MEWVDDVSRLLGQRRERDVRQTLVQALLERRCARTGCQGTTVGGHGELELDRMRFPRGGLRRAPAKGGKAPRHSAGAFPWVARPPSAEAGVHNAPPPRGLAGPHHKVPAAA